MPFKAQINGVTVSTNLKVVDFDPGGDGLVGQGKLYFDQQAGGMDLRNMMPVQVWQTFDANGNGVAAKGRLFGGHINLRDTGNIGTTKIWRLSCWDYNIILAKVVRDVSGAKAITLTAAGFANQIQQLFNIVQLNGGSAPPTLIDVTSGVVDFYSSMPGVTMEGGHKLSYYIQQLCDTAQSFVSTIRPHFYMGVGATFGVGDVFGSPVLYIYDGALLPPFTVEYSDTPSGGQKFWFGDFRRVDDSTVLAQRLQSVWNQSSVITSHDDTSQSTYPCPYINHSGTGNTGYWMDEAIVDQSSGSLGQAQIALDRILATKSNPKETFEFETPERVLPGDTVKITNALEGISGVTYRVAKVKISIEPPDVIWSKLTINNRRMMLFDTGDEQVSGLPIEGDHVPPLPPGLPVKNSETFDWSTMQVSANFTIPASPSPDAWQYIAFMHDTVAGLDWSETIVSIASYTPRREFAPNSACTIKVKCVDRNNNWSDFGPTFSWTTIPVPPVLAAPGSFTNTFNQYDDIDDMAQLGFSWTAPADPNFLGIAGYKVIKTQLGVSTTILVGLTLAVNLLLFPGAAYTVTVNAIDGHGRDGAQATLTGTAAGRVWPTLPNPSFENIEFTVSVLSPRGWTFNNNSGSLLWDTSTSSDGARSVRFQWSSGVTPPNILSDFFLANEGNTYFMAGDGKASSASVSPFLITTFFYDATFTQIGTSVASGLPNVGTSWATMYSQGGIAGPAGTRYARMQVAMGGSATVGLSKWIDNLQEPGEIKTPQMKDQAITTSKIADASVTAAKLAATLDFIGLTEVQKTGAFTADNTATVYLCKATSPFTATLPTAVGTAGRVYVFKHVGTNGQKCTLATTSSQLIDGILTYPLLEKNQVVCVQSDGANWQILWQSGLVLESDGTRWLGQRLTLFESFAVNAGATPNNYTVTTQPAKFPAPSAESYWVDSVTWWVRVNTTNNGTNYWTLRFGHINSGLGGTIDYDLNTSALTAGTAAFVTGTAVLNNPHDFSGTNFFSWFFEVRKDTGSPGSLDFWGASIVVRKIYS